ncbi:unnamed protein product [Rotaria sp. Silwood2]|nr:unnamed protein product [Rotaria sp. Silwood2]
MNSLIFLVTIIHFVFAINKNPGHLKPFGSVGSLINIKELDQEYPTVVKLFTYYLPKSEPILSRQILINDDHYSIWETDKKLENDVYGLSNTNIQVESFKSKQRQRIQMTFGEFLDRYEKEPLLFAQNIPTNITTAYDILEDILDIVDDKLKENKKSNNTSIDKNDDDMVNNYYRSNENFSNEETDQEEDNDYIDEHNDL